MWKAEPDLLTGLECWIQAGGAHHSVLSYDVDAEMLRDWARIMDIEFVHITKDTKVEQFERDLFLNDMVWKLRWQRGALFYFSFKELDCVVVGAIGEITFNVQNELLGDGKSLVWVIEGDSISKLFLPKILDYYKKGMFPMDKLMKFYSFKDINEAQAASDRGECIKAVLRMDWV